MSVSLGKVLTSKALDLLHYDNTERRNSAILILTVDRGHFPHVALLSPYQVVAASPHRLYLAVHRGTHTHGLLGKEMRTTLVIQVEPAVEYIKCNLQAAKDWEHNTDDLYLASPSDILEDYSEKAPFLSELRFDTKRIYDAYRTEFNDITSYIKSH